MADKVTVYEKPTWSKCREVKRILTEKGVAFEAVNYLEKPLTAAGLKRLLRSAGIKPADALRTNEAAYREYVAGKKLTDEHLIRVMAEHPELIQRPIVVREGKVVVVRPAERLEKLGI